MSEDITTTINALKVQGNPNATSCRHFISERNMVQHASEFYGARLGWG